MVKAKVDQEQRWRGQIYCPNPACKLCGDAHQSSNVGQIGEGVFAVDETCPECGSTMAVHPERKLTPVPAGRK